VVSEVAGLCNQNNTLIKLASLMRASGPPFRPREISRQSAQWSTNGYSTIIGTPAREDDELVGGGSWPRSVLMEMDDKFTSAVREAFAAGNESATAAAATVVTTTSRRR
jgi:hypothetical protein